jgi:hypothetical protein
MGTDTSGCLNEDATMNIEVSFSTYKSLVLQLVDEDDNFDQVIDRLVAACSRPSISELTPVNQRDPGFWYRNGWHRSANAIDVYIEFLDLLARDYENFIESFEKKCANLGNSRPYIAKDQAALYPEFPHLQRHARRLGDWWVDGNIKNQQKLDLMFLAAEAAGLEYGVDVKFSIPNAG